MEVTEIPHERIFVAEVARLWELRGIERPEFWQIRLLGPYYFPHGEFLWKLSSQEFF